MLAHPLAVDPERREWRRRMRACRQALSPREQLDASLALRDRLLASPLVTAARHIALYLANDGEIDPAALMAALWQDGKAVYLPVLHPFARHHLLFLRHEPDASLSPNRFGIPEPPLDVRRVRPVTGLDLICCPLVAFDSHGNRLGMGGGFYDRTLASARPRPAIVGLAHDCQRVEALPVAVWDVPLDGIFTPRDQYAGRDGGRFSGSPA